MSEMKGQNSGALSEEEGNTHFLNADWKRVCAPVGQENSKMYLLIFWNKNGPEEKPSWDNQVSFFCHCL